MSKSKRTAKPPIDNRLLDTAIEQFGRKGLEGASTREIAKAAQTAMSSITYHYGGKDGLYLAAARHIGEKVKERFAPLLAAAPDPDGLSAAAAAAQLAAMIDSLMGLLLSPEAAAWSRFIVREQAEPTRAFTIIWEEFQSGLSAYLVKLVLRASNGRWKPAEAKLRAVTLFGQVLVFRVARATALRVTGWEDIGAAQAAEIRRALQSNLRAILTAS